MSIYNTGFVCDPVDRIPGLLVSKLRNFDARGGEFAFDCPALG